MQLFPHKIASQELCISNWGSVRKYRPAPLRLSLPLQTSFTFTLVTHALTKYQVNCASQTQNYAAFNFEDSCSCWSECRRRCWLGTPDRVSINIVRLWPPLRFRTRTSKDRAINFLLLLFSKDFAIILPTSFLISAFYLLVAFSRGAPYIESFTDKGA